MRSAELCYQVWAISWTLALRVQKKDGAQSM
jgi:hypothetical protein